MKGNLKLTSGNSFTPLGGPKHTLLTEVKLRLRRRLYGGAIPVSAAFVLRVFAYKGLKAARWRSPECPGSGRFKILHS